MYKIVSCPPVIGPSPQLEAECALIEANWRERVKRRREWIERMQSVAKPRIRVKAGREVVSG